MSQTYALTPEIIAALVAVDTPTICNALEIVDGRRRNDGFTRKPVVCARPEMPSVVGFARTATVRCSVPAREAPAELKARRVAYYRYVAEGAGPRITVIEDQDEVPGLGAFWGEVNTAIHKGLGLAGVLTTGSIRDLGGVAPGFQLLAGSVMPSHAHVHVTAFGQPVEVFGLRVQHGDLIHMDRHGAVLIPPGAERELPAAIRLDIAREAPILKAARAPGFTVEALVKAFGEADDVH